MLFLIYGGFGWIGDKISKLLIENGHTIHKSKLRLEEREKILKELEEIKPDRVINCAGKTGTPNVDWCETHKKEVIKSNVFGTLNLIDCCDEKNIHLTNLATGCIFEYDDIHKNGFSEDDLPNFFGSFYSYTKGIVETLSRNYENLLTLRLRMPISDDLHPRNFITKIINYEKVVNIPNSMSILHDLLPCLIKMSENKTTGIVNFVNPGVISHNEILDLYKKYIDPTFEYTNFSIEEQNKILKAGRSNNELDTTKIKSMFPDLPDIKTSIINVFERMKNNKK